MNEHWADKRELGSDRGLRFLLAVRCRLGRLPFRLALIPVVLFYLVTQKSKRAASWEYLERVSAFHRLPRRSTLLMMARHFFRFAESILDKVLAWDPRFAPAHITRHGYEAMAEALSHGKGLLLIGSHLGNLEIARHMAATAREVRLTVLVHTKHSPRFMAMLARMDPSSQLSLIQVSDISPGTAMLLKDKVDAGEMVMIAGDRVPLTGRGVAWADFLGKPAAFPIGPYVLAAVLECPVFLFFCLGHSGSYDVHFEHFAERVLLPRRSRAADLQSLVARYAERLGHYCGRSPLSWGNFYAFWADPETTQP